MRLPAERIESRGLWACEGLNFPDTGHERFYLFVAGGGYRAIFSGRQILRIGIQPHRSTPQVANLLEAITTAPLDNHLSSL